MGCLQLRPCWICCVEADSGDFFLKRSLELLVLLVLCLERPGRVNFEAAVALLVTGDVDRFHFPVLNIIDLYFRVAQVPRIWDFIGVHVTESYVCRLCSRMLVVEVDHQTVEVVSILVYF